VQVEEEVEVTEDQVTTGLVGPVSGFDVVDIDEETGLGGVEGTGFDFEVEVRTGLEFFVAL